MTQQQFQKKLEKLRNITGPKLYREALNLNLARDEYRIAVSRIAGVYLEAPIWTMFDLDIYMELARRYLKGKERNETNKT